MTPEQFLKKKGYIENEPAVLFWGDFCELLQGYSDQQNAELMMKIEALESKIHRLKNPF